MRAAVVLLLCSICAPVAAQDDYPDVLPEADDPIAEGAESREVERAVADELRESAEDRRLHAPRAPQVEPRRGGVLTAPPGVRESGHEVLVRLEDGLAIVDETIRFTSMARLPAEVLERLAIPDEGFLVDLEVCDLFGCRVGVRTSAESLHAYSDAVRARGPGAVAPVAFAEPVRDARGAALRVQAAPVRKGEELRLRLRWAAPAPVVGGVVRFVFPARGSDAQTAPVSVRVETGGLGAPRIAGEPGESTALIEAWERLEVSAEASGSAPVATVWQGACDPGSEAARGAQARRVCGRVRVVAPRRVAGPVDVVLLIDASPSMAGPARGRLPRALAALLAGAPAGSSFRAVAFAGRAQAVLAEATAADQVPLVPLADAPSTPELGSATRFERGWAVARAWLADSRRPRVVVLGDGGITEGEGLTEAFEEATRAGVEVSVVSLADRPTVRALAEGAERTGGVVVDVGAQAEAAQDATVLAERLAAVFAPVLVDDVIVQAGTERLRLGPLRAGEERTWAGVLAGVRPRLSLGGFEAGAAPNASALVSGLAAQDRARQALAAIAPSETAATCDLRGPPQRPDGASTDALPVVLASPRTCRVAPATPPPLPRPDAGLPAQSVLRMLRQRLVPLARACFRADRAGRTDYAVHVSYAFRLADREVLSAEVDGALSDPLRACLIAATDALEVPPFDGSILVSWPLHTARVDDPPVIELESPVADHLDRVVGTGVAETDARALVAPP